MQVPIEVLYGILWLFGVLGFLMILGGIILVATIVDMLSKKKGE